MDHIVVKTEMQANEEILLFYVDEDGGNEVVTNIARADGVEQHIGQLQQDSTYVMEDTGDSVEEVDLTQGDQAWNKERWLDDETKRLLIFYIDNKETFVSGATRKKHLWTVACKTMLTGKNSTSCEMKLRNMKRKYSQVRIDQKNGVNNNWPYFDLCHQAFHDDPFVNMLVNENYAQNDRPLLTIPIKSKTSEDGIVVVKKVNSTRTAGDSKVELMLNLYLKHKKNFQKDHWQRGLWETIAIELGEDDAEYWHKRFLNFKQHYIRLLDKREESGSDSVNWPYMKLFDQIFEGDEEFQRKFASSKRGNIEPALETRVDANQYDWDDTEMTVLVKYYFDCFQEFQDPTIPDNFLWNEVGRLLDKIPETCKWKYNELKKAHMDKYVEGGYDLRSRIPLAILFDNIISRETQLELNKESKRDQIELWKTEEIDELVQFLYENIEMFKDPVCYYVCWVTIGRKLRRSIHSCKRQWEDLTTLYKTILEDKKENPDMQIDWRYIELFDRIFDYGMDTNLLEGYEKFQEQNLKSDSGKVGVKKVNIKIDSDNTENGTDDEESFDERGFTKRTKRRTGDSKAFKILEFYQKNKDKFSTTQRKKQALWEILARQIGISATQCAHRFRNLKQVYTAYVQREINKPEMPILWPYYALCKKVFGYRALKSKLKNGKMDSDDGEDWSAKEIKQVINYFSQNFDDINNDVEDKNKWLPLASEIGKTESACCEKFLELRKSYRKLKTMKARNPEVKVSWKYFNMFDEIYNSREGETYEVVQEAMEIDDMDDKVYEMPVDDDIKNGLQEDDDYQCIIVIPEGQEITDISGAQIITEHPENPTEVITETSEQLNNSTEIKTGLTKWTKRTKKRLLILYLNYLRSHKGTEINPTEMWKEISSKLPNKTPLSCRKMFAKLKNTHIELAAINENDVNKKKTPYYILLEKILSHKPRFTKTAQTITLPEGKAYKDVPLPTMKVHKALDYYLQHIEEFINPKFEKKYLWMQLANHISEPLTKVYHKINYLKKYYNCDTHEVAGEETPFSEQLKEILVKEDLLKDLLDKDPKPQTSIEIDEIEQPWSDDETEQLLIWYLTNLEKFKNPKFVRSYLWMEASNILKKSPLVCSKKMSEIRKQYKTMIKMTPEELDNWRFYALCQKIYGTGKKCTPVSND